ncbi:MAG: hypothetical protein GF383_05900 [Candidatus Lokiarchaeota archaeon]|nr:hypothetical protein [Candidatus Lokiarchaeota archaeon]MBD3339475.1 hypothetical protein [Candidatus Lokiarchaeota archaeon]
MNSLIIDTERIGTLIINGYYEKAAEDIFRVLENKAEVDNEILYKTLDLLSLICDKKPSISLKTIKYVEEFIVDPESWIRLVSMEILYQISIFRPNLLIDLIDKIRTRMFDRDSSVRRLTVKLIGNLILSLHIDQEQLQEIIDEFTEKLMENDWKVKFQVIKTLKKILNQDYKKIRDLEPLLSMVIINLREEDEDVARAAADLLKMLGTYFLSKDKIFYILLNLLYNEKPRVKEQIIWLFGEIGKERSSEIIPIIPKLIKLLKKNDYRIHLKVFDALVSIGVNNFNQIWSNLIDSLDTSNNDFRNNLINALYLLSQKNIKKIFPYLFEELENPSENIRGAMGLVFKRLYEEYQIEIENEITKILYRLESKYWRERKNTIILLRIICFILKNQKLAVWISIELNRALKRETDFDVKEEIIYTIDDIKTYYKNLKDDIRQVKKQLSLFDTQINKFQKLPARFRENLNSLIEENKFKEVETQLNKLYSNALNEIKEFHNEINSFEFKRLAFDLIEEWEETKVQIIDELSIIKGFISELCDEKKESFKSTLEKKIQLLDRRIDVLTAQFEYVKEFDFKNYINSYISEENLDKTDEFYEKFSSITQIRKNLFKLDVDIRDMLIDNLEFDQIFKEFLTKWISTKIQIQEYLGDLDLLIRSIKEEISNDYFQKDEYEEEILVTENLNGFHNELTYQLLQGHIQSIILHGIDVLKKFNENFTELRIKLENLMTTDNFSNFRKLLEMRTKQIQMFISETENEIDNVIRKENIQDNNTFNLFVRPYIDRWHASKELMINKLKYFRRKNLEDLYLSQLNYYLNIINPIKMKLLSSYMELDEDTIKEFVLKYVRKNKINARIVKDTIYSEVLDSELPHAKDLLLFKNIKTSGNKIYLHFKLNNPSNHMFADLQISLKTPAYLKFLKDESFPKYIHLDELKTGNIFKFNYTLKINRKKQKNLTDPSVDEIKLNIHYKDPFDITRKTTKKINILLT